MLLELRIFPKVVILYLLHEYDTNYKPYRARNLYIVHQSSFLTPQFERPVSGQLLDPAFITICVSLGVRCSAPPPGGTYTNEDTTSNEHPPPSVLNYSAVPLPEPTRHPELQQKKKKTQLKHKRHKPPRPPRAEIEDTCPCPLCRSAMFEGCSSSEAVCACLCVGKRVFVHYTVSCAIIWY